MEPQNNLSLRNMFFEYKDSQPGNQVLKFTHDEINRIPVGKQVQIQSDHIHQVLNYLMLNKRNDVISSKKRVYLKNGDDQYLIGPLIQIHDELKNYKILDKETEIFISRFQQVIQFNEQVGDSYQKLKQFLSKLEILISQALQHIENIQVNQSLQRLDRGTLLEFFNQGERAQCQQFQFTNEQIAKLLYEKLKPLANQIQRLRTMFAHHEQRIIRRKIQQQQKKKRFQTIKIFKKNSILQPIQFINYKKKRSQTTLAFRLLLYMSCVLVKMGVNTNLQHSLLMAKTYQDQLINKIRTNTIQRQNSLKQSKKGLICPITKKIIQFLKQPQLNKAVRHAQTI